MNLDETEKIISENDDVEELIRKQNITLQRNKIESTSQTDNIFPTCENGEVFDCEDINSDKVLDERCKGILQFNNGTSSCSCQGKNDTVQKSDHILRQGWTQFTRYIN